MGIQGHREKNINAAYRDAMINAAVPPFMGIQGRRENNDKCSSPPHLMGIQECRENFLNAAYRDIRRENSNAAVLLLK